MPSTDKWPDLIEVLACDTTLRPKAPGPGDLIPFVLGQERAGGALVVRFDPVATDLLRRFVDAEQICCAGLGWEIDSGDGLQLRVAARASQLDALETILAR